MKEMEIAQLNKRIGSVLKARRKQLGMTQKDISQHVGVTYQQVQKYESGRDTLSIARAIPFCKHLGLDFSDFLGGNKALIEAAASMPVSMVKNFDKLSEGEKESVAALILSLAKKKG